eukprot:1153905-Rhodomonas_salina.1
MQAEAQERKIDSHSQRSEHGNVFYPNSDAGEEREQLFRALVLLERCATETFGRDSEEPNEASTGSHRA